MALGLNILLQASQCPLPHRANWCWRRQVLNEQMKSTQDKGHKAKSNRTGVREGPGMLWSDQPKLLWGGDTWTMLMGHGRLRRSGVKQSSAKVLRQETAHLWVTARRPARSRESRRNEVGGINASPCMRACWQRQEFGFYAEHSEVGLLKRVLQREKTGSDICL